MKVIIAGSRTIRSYTFICAHLDKINWGFTEIVSGREPKGVDSLGEEYARCHGIKIKKFPADWARYGRAAGPIRNYQMAKYADALIAFWDGKSPGTQDMINVAKHRKLKIKIIICDL